MDTKYFKSRHGKSQLPKEWDAVIKAIGVNVYDIIVPCERAVILGGFWENPSAFKDVETYVFYMLAPLGSFLGQNQRLYVDILRLYYDNIHNITDLEPTKAAEYIRGILEAD